MAYNNDGNQTGAPLGNPLTSNSAFVPSELDRSQQTGQGISHHDQYQQSSNPVSSHEHHTPQSGSQGMTNNFSAVPSSNTPAMTQGFAPVPTGHQHGSHETGGNLGSHEGHKDKREDGGVVDALNPMKGGGTHLPHSGDKSHDQHQQHSGATPLTYDRPDSSTRQHNDGSAPFASNPSGPHGDQSLLSGHHSHRDATHDSSVAGSGAARGLSVEESRAHGGGVAYPDPHHTSRAGAAQHNTSNPNSRFDNPIGHGTTNVHGSHGTTGAYGAPATHLPGQGAKTGETLPGHNESSPFHHDKKTHNNDTHGHATDPIANTFITPGHEDAVRQPVTGTPASGTSHGAAFGAPHGSSAHGEHGGATHAATGTQHGEHGLGEAHKPTMGEKVKGGVASLVGKMTNNPEKVAEGEALKTGQPVGHAGGVGSTGHSTGGIGHSDNTSGGLGHSGVGHDNATVGGLHGSQQQPGTGGTQMGGLGAQTGGVTHGTGSTL